MKHLSIILMAALLTSACQKEGSDPTEAASANSATAAPSNELTGRADNPADSEPREALEGADTLAIARAINHPDRPDTDRERDPLRRPDKVLALSGIRPGMIVLDVFTAGGYYAEILSRLVGDDGEVWAQNPPQFYERYGSADLDFRLADRRLPNVERQDRPLEDLALPAGRFDAVVAALVFHDFFWLTEDVSAVLAQLNTALKPGGIMLVTDHSAPLGTGSEMAEDLDGKHRVEPALVTRMMADAGFELVTTSDVLANPDDDRTLAFFDPQMRGKPTDRFVHVYRKVGLPTATGSGVD